MEEEFTYIWKALADPTRRTILDLLKERPHTTGELSSLFQVSRFAVMKHLAVLEQAGLVIVKRAGRERWNYLNAIPLQQIYERWLKPYEARWAASFLTMKRYVETNEEKENAMSTLTSAVKFVHIEMEIPIKASPQRIFKALTYDIAAWWDREHCTYHQGQMVLEPELGKRYYEKWAGGEALFGIVTLIEPDRVLELEGTLGMNKPAQGVARYELIAQGETTLMKFSHHAFGDFTPNTQQDFESGWRNMFEYCLRPLLEKEAD
ncbi:metalloregulator ArsR/SmtB family transcription factor [Ktedonosporobacter rubrisoli]|uniref:Metalloregulator ArsR/SmtB family transcription factor n=1 Tax=Ktedonosporobacter rubrisoli TaxID=2509675 RepID=A0A4P6JK61_KTERU|nr:metalloregulator ArsR/SmtB family transcription factor [Ktedonosporobacter rubrisoli]QBD75538.1 metalloregulator ArsR/SmtB family transcription factor [Ktedonosporobacter rubrisoli]